MMKNIAIGLALIAAAAVPASADQGQRQERLPQTERGTITFYDQTNYNGREWDVEDANSRFRWVYNIRSIAVHPGDSWQICARPRYQECITLSRSVPDATMIGIEGQIGSVRPAAASAPSESSGN